MAMESKLEEWYCLLDIMEFQLNKYTWLAGDKVRTYTTVNSISEFLTAILL
jgi:hypothetical protein